jgi:SAM-dependent methyltransferase
MERSFLDKYHRIEREHWWFRVRGSIIGDLISGYSGTGEEKKILNVGAATGRSTEILQPFGRVKSLEFDGPSYEYCRDILKLDIVQGSVTELPFEDDSFDLVCAFDVIEHVEDDGLAVRELIRVCKPGGIVFVTVPAFMSLWSVHDEVNLHYRRYRKDGLQLLFTGGRILRTTYFNTLLFPLIWIARSLGNKTGRGGKNTKPDNEWMQSRLTDFLFGSIFSMERPLLKNMNLPFGVSLALLWNKDKKHIYKPGFYDEQNK